MEWPDLKFPPVNLWIIGANMAINSQNKGKNYERKIAKILTETLKKPFSRTPSSGAFGTLNKIKSLQGDIICTDTSFDWPYFIECKKYEKVNLYHFPQKAKSCNITKWLAKLLEQKENNQLGLLIFAENRGKDMCLVEIDYPEKMSDLFDDDTVLYLYKNKIFQLMLLSDFLKIIKANT